MAQELRRRVLGADYSDLHHLRAADWSVNSARGNLWFGECDPASDSSCSSPAHAEAADDTAKNAELFQPPAAVRGDIARAMLYMDVRYDGADASTEDLVVAACSCADQFTLGNLSVLLRWHADDPVDAVERLRNNRTCARCTSATATRSSTTRASSASSSARA